MNLRDDDSSGEASPRDWSSYRRAVLDELRHLRLDAEKDRARITAIEGVVNRLDVGSKFHERTRGFLWGAIASLVAPFGWLVVRALIAAATNASSSKALP